MFPAFCSYFASMHCLLDREATAGESSGASLCPKQGGWALILVRIRLTIMLCKWNGLIKHEKESQQNL